MTKSKSSGYLDITQLIELSQSINASLDLQEVMQTACRIVTQSVDATSAYIAVIDMQRGTTTTQAEYFSSYANDKEKVSDMGINYSLADLYNMEYQGQSIKPYSVTLSSDQIKDFQRQQLLKYGGKSYLVVPIMLDNEQYGFIEIWESREEREFTQEEITFLQLISNQVSVALHNATLYTQLSQSEYYFRNMLDNALDMICTIDNDGLLKYFNSSFARILAYPDELLTRVPISHLIHEDHRESVLKTLTNMTGALRLETILITQDREEIPVEGTITLNDQNGVREYDAIFRDIRERRQMEVQNQALHEAKTRSNILNQFIQDASHDLKTPLSVIKSSTYLSQRIAERDELDQIKPYLQNVTNNADNLNQILDDMLMIVSLDTFTTLEQSSIPLQRVFANVIEATDDLRQERQITLTSVDIMPDAQIVANEAYLHEALTHLLNNAYQFTPNQGEVEFYGQPQNDAYHFVIRDNGIGISTEAQEHLFDYFYKVDKARQGTGSGLGLSIVKRIAELHGGTVYITSEFGVGTTITLVIPMLD